MRYISELFREKQNQIIRPPLKLYFEIDAEKSSVLLANIAFTEDFFDATVVPVVRPKDCLNQHYYAVVGDGMPVDDPNRMCAPNFYGTMPKTSVPYGISPYLPADYEYVIGDDTYYKNFVGIPFGGTLSFKGGLIPERVVVEKYEYQSSSWVVEQTINNPDLNEEISFTTSSVDDAGKYRRFKVYSSSAGRYQVNWIKNRYRNLESVVFENSQIMSANIDEETDLTSQTLPSYEMTVVCLDVNGVYSPESEYWNKQFVCGMPCVFKAGYESAGITEYLPLFKGVLKESPKYENRKITFKVNISFTLTSVVEGFYSRSISDENLVPGDIVNNRLFKDVVNGMFTTYDVFHGEVDERGSEYNYYGIIDNNDIRQLVANAMGCFITAGIGTIDLHNTNDIQYNTFDYSYLARYDQAKNVLESKSKVGMIKITRNEYTLSENYYDAEATEAVAVPTSGSVTTEYTLSFWAYGKFELIDAQASDPSATITVDGYSEELNGDGTVKATIRIRSDVSTTAQPIFRFYEVDRTEYEENKTVDINSNETYVNDNELVANGYNAGKVKRVAQFMSDISDQYEVDVVQNLAREVGDIIRLETEKNVFKTCVVTGLKFALPGSKGHITCRKVFSPMDSPYYQTDINNMVFLTDNTHSYAFLQTLHNSCIVGKLTYTNGGPRPCYLVVGARYIYDQSTSSQAGYVDITDDNKHVWRVHVIEASTAAVCAFPYVDLGEYNSAAAPVNNEAAFAAMKLIMKLYEDQHFVSPVTFDSEYVVH